jgi:L-threonylcarbamoyladenylate synthase
MTKTERLAPNERGIARAAALLADGALVAFPTETVYGLGADATDARAVAAIFEAKGRPRFNPLIVHVASREAAERLVELPEAGRRLAAAFWPGPLTLVAARRADAGIADLATAGLPTLAVRVPAHPLALALLRAVGRPIAAPSANPSGRISPTTAGHVLDGLGGRIAAVLDGGPCEVGLESTIIGLSGEAPALLRPGGLPAEAAEAALGQPLQAPSGGISAPGQLASHYAPRAGLRLDAAAPREGELWLGFGPSRAVGGGAALNLSPTGDLHEAAANLFGHLRTLDARAAPGQVIAVAPVPLRGLGRAINDRLARAAAPREETGA